MIDDADDDIGGGDVDDERGLMECTRKFFLLKLKALLYPSFSFPSGLMGKGICRLLWFRRLLFYTVLFTSLSDLDFKVGFNH